MVRQTWDLASIGFVSIILLTILMLWYWTATGQGQGWVIQSLLVLMACALGGRMAVRQAHALCAAVHHVPELIDQYRLEHGRPASLAEVELLMAEATNPGHPDVLPPPMWGAQWYYRNLGHRYVLGLKGPWYAHYEYSSRRHRWNLLEWGW